MVELMFVVAIVGVLAAVGMTNYRSAVEVHRIEGYRKSIQRTASAARLEALSRNIPVAFLISGQYAIAATGVDLNNDGFLAWVDSNGDGVPNPQPAAGVREGELFRVIDYTRVLQTGISLIAGPPITLRGNSYDTGCNLAANGADCPTTGLQVLFRPDGFVYEMSAVKTPATFTMASLLVGVQRNATVDVERNDYALVRIGAGGIVEGFGAQ